MDLKIIWFVLIGVLLTGYAILDGFDLGVGVLYPFVARERGRAPPVRASDRPRLGRQRGVARSPAAARCSPPSRPSTPPSSAASTWP